MNKIILLSALALLAIIFATGYKPSRYWRLKRLDGKPTLCPKCGSPDTTTTMRGALADYLHHVCNVCGKVWTS